MNESHRQCSGCTLCCRLVPVPIPLGKGANVRCRFQHSAKGCTIHARRPNACREWSCGWLLRTDHTDNLTRPDRSHCVIDPESDYVVVTNPSGDEVRLDVVQIWCDPNHPNAHRAPALRRYMEAMARDFGFGTLVRFSSSRSIVVLAPSLTSDQAWHETDADAATPSQRSATMARHRRADDAVLHGDVPQSFVAV